MKLINYSNLLFLGAFSALCTTTIAQKTTHPNILIIFTDQHAWDAVGYAGNRIIKTPNLDRLAREGVNFSHAVTPCPVCAPARTSILTGRLTEITTIRENADVTGDCYYPTFDEILAKRGYSTEIYGKFHSPEHMAKVYMNPPVKGMVGTEPIVRWESIYKKYIQENFKKRALKPGELFETTFYGGTVPYKLDPTDRSYQFLPSGELPEEDLKLKKLGQDDVHGVLDLPADYTITAIQGKQTLEALERLKDKQFILTCSFHCPHVPITPSEPYASLYKAKDMITPISFDDQRKNSPYNPGKAISPYNEKDKIQYMTANYYAFVTEIDEWVGKILNKLDELKLTNETMVIFVSDHGEMLGAHGMRGKFCFYEESVRVPFLIRYPGKIKAGQTISTPISTLNINPTILEFAGLKSIPSDGYSLKNVMEGTASPKYDFAISEWQWKNENIPSIMIRTENWKLMTTHRNGGKNVEVLFDLKNDPYEINNLLGTNPERFKYQDTVENLRSKLVSYLKDVNYPLVKGVEQRILIRK